MTDSIRENMAQYYYIPLGLMVVMFFIIVYLVYTGREKFMPATLMKQQVLDDREKLTDGKVGDIAIPSAAECAANKPIGTNAWAWQENVLTGNAYDDSGVITPDSMKKESMANGTDLTKVLAGY